MRRRSRAQSGVARAAAAAIAVLCVTVVLAPSAHAAGSGVPLSVGEGASFSGTVATFAHSALSATIDWGDQATPSTGTVTQTGNGTTVSGSHSYAEEGTYTVTITEQICNQTGCVDTATTAATVSDASLTASGASFSATSGTAFSGDLATFTDGDPNGAASDYSATVDWGDGSTSAGTVSAAPGGGFTVDGSHTYAAAGSDPVKVTISDQGGAHGSASATATVSGPTPVAYSVSTTSATAGNYVRFDASPTSAGAAVKSYSWDFSGTGTPQAMCGGDTPVIYHLFDSAGTHTVSLFESDTSGQTVRYDRTINITAPPGKLGQHPGQVSSFRLPDALTTQPPSGPSSAVLHVAPRPVGSCPQIESQPPPRCHAHQNNVSFGLFDALATPGWCQEQRDVGSGKFSLPITVWSANPGQAVRINGVDVTPQPGVSVVLDPASNRVFSDGGSGLVSLSLAIPSAYGGSADLGTVKLDWKPGHASELALPDLTLPPDDRLLGLLLDGSASAKLVQNATAVTLHVQLPDAFQLPGGGTITSDVTVGADNYSGGRLDGLDIELADLFLGGLEIKDFGLSYQRDQDMWEGHGTVVLPTGLSIAAEPPAPYGFGIKDSGFDHAGATVSFPDPGVPIAGAINLNSIGVGIGTHPTFLKGDFAISWEGLVRFNGHVLVAVGNHDEPLNLCSGVLAAQPPLSDERGLLCGDASDLLLSDPAFFSSGDLTLHLPVLGDVNVASAYANWWYPDYFEFGGHIGFSTPSFGPIPDGFISAEADFHANARPSAAQFDIEGGAYVCAIWVACAGGDFVLSSHGVGGCLRLPWPAPDIGGWVTYPPHFDWSFMWHACDASAAREVVTHPFHAVDAGIASAGPVAIKIGPRQRAAIIGIKGTTSPPSVILTGPRGEHVATPNANGLITRSPYVFLRVPQVKETFVIVEHPSPGLWKLAPMPGSASIASVEQGFALPKPSVTAWVTGRQRAFALHYSIRPIPDQTVEFAEHGAHMFRVIGRARGAVGTLRFSPGRGAGGRRQIEARVFSYGHLRKVVTVASYRAPAPPPPPTPRGVSVRRVRGSLLISWKRTAGATRYGVAAILSDGRHIGFVVRGRRHSVPIAGFGSRESAVVRVMTLSGDNNTGRKVTVRVLAVKPPRHRRRR